MTNPYYKIPYEVREWLKPRTWFDEYKWARQRVSRGWSDKDTWGGGEHILRVTTGILHALNDDKNPIDWDMYWKVNFPTIDKYGYKDLGDPARAIDKYIDFYEKHEWTERIDFELHSFTLEGENKYTKKQEAQISAAIKAHNAETKAYYKEAQKAMKFVADNINGLWW